MSPKSPVPRPADCERTRVRAQPLAIAEPPRPHALPASVSGAPSRRRAQGFEVHADSRARYITLLTVTGPLDARGEPHLLTAARLALASSYVLILDLRRLTRCDAAGVHAVLAVDALARAVSAVLVIRPADKTLHHAFEENDAAGRLRFLGPTA